MSSKSFAFWESLRVLHRHVSLIGQDIREHLQTKLGKAAPSRLVRVWEQELKQHGLLGAAVNLQVDKEGVSMRLAVANC